VTHRRIRNFEPIQAYGSVMSDPTDAHVTVERSEARFILFGGIAGVLGVASYIIGIAVDFQSAGASLAAIASFCLLSVVSGVALRDAIAGGTRSRIADIALLLLVAAFATLLAMVAVQLAVRAHAQPMLEAAAAGQTETLRLAVQLTRQVDLGLDVAWDLLVGAALFGFGVAMIGSSRFRLLWGLPLSLLALALVGLNLATFPVPPASAGLFDLGPFVGLYMAALSIRLITIGARMLRRVSRAPGVSH
jgi:hypothetical protein